MDIQKLHNIKSGFVTREVNKELILVPLTDSVAQMNKLFTLNETGKFIWENINPTSTIEELKTKMTDCFEIDSETAGRDIETFLMQLEGYLVNE